MHGRTGLRESDPPSGEHAADNPAGLSRRPYPKEGPTMESKTKKKLGAAGASVAVVGAAIALTAGTFSYFSDTAQGAQKAQAGTLKLNGKFTQKADLSNLVPGDTIYTLKYTLTNTGSLPGTLRLELDRGSGSAALAKALKVQIPAVSQKYFPLTAEEGHAADVGTLNAKGEKGNTKTFTVNVKFPDDGTDQNALQGKKLTELVKADLVQGTDGPAFQAPSRNS
jgi:predicted ribosomally synthesized peptide with SipW-like signal peptide